MTAIRNQGTIMTIKTGGPDESKWTSSPRSAYNLGRAIRRRRGTGLFAVVYVKVLAINARGSGACGKAQRGAMECGLKNISL